MGTYVELNMSAKGRKEWKVLQDQLMSWNMQDDTHMCMPPLDHIPGGDSDSPTWGCLIHRRQNSQWQANMTHIMHDYQDWLPCYFLRWIISV